MRRRTAYRLKLGHIMLDLISELEDAVNGGSSEKRVSTLRRVTDLFLHDEQRLTEDQVKVFDEVLCVLVTRVESRVRAELSARLAPAEHAPFEVVQRLARDNEIAVAGSVLASSNVLRTSDLVEIAARKVKITCWQFRAGKIYRRLLPTSSSIAVKAGSFASLPTMRVRDFPKKVIQKS